MVVKPLCEFVGYFTGSIKDETFVKLTLGKYRGKDPNLLNMFVRHVRIKEDEKLSLTYRYRTRDIVKNYDIEEGTHVIASLLGTEFFSANLFTLNGDMQLQFSKRLKSTLNFSKPTSNAIPTKIHNEKKRRYIALEDNLYLEALGVTDNRGSIRNRMGDKWRQINKFLEVVSNLYEGSPLSSQKDISILDMGSGKGYLTFAIYDYFNNVRGIKACVTGVEARDDMVELCNDIARKAGFNDLRFNKGFVESYPVTGVDILIALHACNTATDDAIHKGIVGNASIIMGAPCCHKQIRPQIVSPTILRGILKHGILLERQAEMITDGLRALLLEYSGYSTKVFEFISVEHTQKNTMITGTRQATRADKLVIRAEISKIKDFFGIKEHYLEHLLFRDDEP